MHSENLAPHPVSETVYKRRIWAWTCTIGPIRPSPPLSWLLYFQLFQPGSRSYFTQRSNGYILLELWPEHIVVIVAILSPILGTVSDVMRGKKRFLAIFAGIGILGTGLLVVVSTGDWVLALILGIIGRIGFSGSISFYDALLPHVQGETIKTGFQPAAMQWDTWEAGCCWPLTS